MVSPAWRRASARASPMLTPRLHCHIALRIAPGCGSSNRMRAARRIYGPLTSVDIPEHTAKEPWPRSVLPAPQRINHAVQVVRPDQDVPGLGSLAGPDDAAALQQVHQPAGLGEPDAQLALQHGRGAELGPDDEFRRLHQQFQVVADVGVDLPLLALGGRDVLPVGRLRLARAVADHLTDFLLRDEGVLQAQRLAGAHRADTAAD